MLINNENVTGTKRINKELHHFYNSLFSNRNLNSTESSQILLNSLEIPKLKIEDANSCEGSLTESELFKALTSMENNKSALQRNSMKHSGKKLKVHLCVQ